MAPEGFPQLGVTLLGEALGEAEAKHSRPFIGAAGLRLGRMIERAGFKRDQFQILNAVWCRPPQNTPPPQEAIEHCRQYWEPLVTKPETKVILAMGNAPLFATLGLEGVLSKRGYVWWSDKYQAFVIPTVHPSFILRGNSNWESAFIYDLRHAVEVADKGWEPIERDYSLDISPHAAMEWAKIYALRRLRLPELPCSADIETPDKSDAEDETDINLGYQAGPIYRIGFAYIWNGKTQVLSIPWNVAYLDVINYLFSLDTVWIFCYRHFDVPRITAHNVRIDGQVADLQEAWHVLQSSLPKSLEHMAPYLVPRQAAWKHLSGSQPALYNGIDAAVQIEGWYRCKELLEEHGMWNVYYDHIFMLNPILLYMTSQGMPIDLEARKEAALKLMGLKEEVKVRLNEAAEGARPTKIFKKFREGLQEISLEGSEKYCSECGKVRVNAKHPCFKVGNAEGEVALGELCSRVIPIKGYVQPLDFKPSHVGLLRYAKFKGYRLISRFNRQKGERVFPMDENAIRLYSLRHLEDPIFKLVLDYRELDKLQGTYVGRLTDQPPVTLSPEQKWHEEWRRAQYREVEGPKDYSPYHSSQPITKGSIEADDDIPF